MQTYIIKETRPKTDTADMIVFKEYLVEKPVGKTPDEVKNRLKIRNIRGRRKFDEQCMRFGIKKHFGIGQSMSKKNKKKKQ